MPKATEKETKVDQGMEAVFPPLPRVHEIATCYGSPIIAVIEIDGKVGIWDLSSGRKLSQFMALWDIGGRRLAISDDGQLCAAGAYQKHGVAVHETSTGNRIWQRKDLNRVQKLRFSVHRNAVLAGIDEQAFHIVDALTGKDHETLRGVDDIWESQFGRQCFLRRRSGAHEVLDLDSREKKFIIKPTTFAVLDACFTENHLAISEAAGPTSLYSLNSGALVWRYWESDYRNGKLAYSPEAHAIMAINADLTKQGGARVIAFDLETGKVTRRILRDDLGLASFAIEGSRVVTWYGDVVDTTSGEVVSHLDFSQ